MIIINSPEIQGEQICQTETDRNVTNVKIALIKL